MTKIKRIIAFVLVLCCVFSMNMVTFAETSNTVNVVFDANGGTFDISQDSSTWIDQSDWGLGFGDSIYNNRTAYLCCTVDYKL